MIFKKMILRAGLFGVMVSLSCPILANCPDPYTVDSVLRKMPELERGTNILGLKIITLPLDKSTFNSNSLEKLEPYPASPKCYHIYHIFCCYKKKNDFASNKICIGQEKE